MATEIKDVAMLQECIDTRIRRVDLIKAAATAYNLHILSAIEEIARTENLINNQTVKVFKIEKEIEILTAAAENSADAKETDKIQFDIECKTREIENAKNLVKEYNQSILNAIAKIGVHEDVITKMNVEISAAMKEIEDLQTSIVEVIEVDVTEYAVSPDAQEVAVQAEVDNAAREVAVEEVTTTADLETQLSEVQTAMSQNDWDIRYRQIRIENNKNFLAQALAVIEETENDILEDEEQISAYEKHKEELQALAENLQAEIINRKLNAAAVGMVDDGTNEEDAETLTVDYNFDDEDSDDELIDTPIEYHIEIPAIVELEPVTFALERFGEDSDNAAMREELEDEINCKLAAIAGLEKEVAELREKLKAIAPVDDDERILKLELRYWNLQNEVESKRDAAEDEMDAIDAEIEDYLNKAIDEVEEICQKAVKKKFTLVTYDGKRYVINPKKKTEMYVASYTDAEAKLRICIKTDGQRTEVEGYGKIADFKAVMKDLEAAIERGDKEFTLPRGDK